MRNLILKSIAIFATSFILIACSKDETIGPKGDKGDQGIAGTNGTNGSNGAAGTNGANGNANVMYSDWITYSPDFADVSNFKAMRILVPQYTRAFVDSGGFYIAFVKWQDNVQSQLPLLEKFNSTTSPVVQIECTGLSFDNSGELRFSCSRLDGLALQNEFTTLITTNKLKVRYFLIKGNVNLRKANPLRELSYNEICEMYSIPK